jgi:uncharacterized YigZ family protein
MLIVPYQPARAETVVVDSRFIASLSRADSVVQARAYITSIRKEFPDARHHVPAFIIGGGASVTEFCSDDGEPAGTSGRPLLTVLKGSGLGNVAVVVSRYFGGTLLGTGGLVKAYSEAGRAVLQQAKKARLVEMNRCTFPLPYNQLDRFRMMAADSGTIIISEGFAENVSLCVDVPADQWDEFTTRLKAISSGTILPSVEYSRMAAQAI